MIEANIPSLEDAVPSHAGPRGRQGAAGKTGPRGQPGETGPQGEPGVMPDMDKFITSLNLRTMISGLLDQNDQSSGVDRGVGWLRIDDVQICWGSKLYTLPKKASRSTIPFDFPKGCVFKNKKYNATATMNSKYCTDLGVVIQIDKDTRSSATVTLVRCQKRFLDQ